MSEYAERFAENRIDFSRSSRSDRSGPKGPRRCLSAIGAKCCTRLRSLPVPLHIAAACVDRTEDPRHRRTPSGHGDVLRLGRLNGTFGPHGPGGPSRGHFGLSEVRRGDRGSLRRVRSEVHGRRRTDLLRLSAGPRGRRRARGAGGAGVGRGGERPQDARTAANSCRHRDGTGGGRRPDRIGCFSGASNRWRDAEPCGTLAGRCRAEHGRDCRKHAQAARQSVRA